LQSREATPAAYLVEDGEEALLHAGTADAAVAEATEALEEKGQL